MAKTRVTYIDFIKAVAIFMIITLHNGTWHTDFIASGNLSNVVQYCVRLFCEGVPIFMLVNGFLMFHRPFDAKKHIKRTLNIVSIILIWSLIMEVFFTIVYKVPFNFWNVIKSVLETNISTGNATVLWFLQALVVVYLVYPILKVLYDNYEKLFNYLLLVLILSTFVPSLLWLFYSVTGFAWLQPLYTFLNQYTLTIGNNIYVLYFMLGGYLYKNMETLCKKRIVIAGVICAVMACMIGVFLSYKDGATYLPNYNYSQIFLMFTIVGAFLLCSKIPFNNKTVNKVLASIGDNTMGIYLTHQMVIYLVWLIPFQNVNLLLRLAMSLLVFLVSWGITLLIRLIPKASFLVKL